VNFYKFLTKEEQWGEKQMSNMGMKKYLIIFHQMLGLATKLNEIDQGSFSIHFLILKKMRWFYIPCS